VHCGFFGGRDLDINSTTLKLEGDLDRLKVYLHTENEVARLRHSELLKLDETFIAITGERRSTNITAKVKGHQLPTTGVDKGGPGGPSSPNGTAKKNFFLKIEGISS